MPLYNGKKRKKRKRRTLLVRNKKKKKKGNGADSSPSTAAPPPTSLPPPPPPPHHHRPSIHPRASLDRRPSAVVASRLLHTIAAPQSTLATPHIAASAPPSSPSRIRHRRPPLSRTHPVTRRRRLLPPPSSRRNPRPAPPSTAAPPPSSHPASSPRPAPTIPKVGVLPFLLVLGL
ncbi:hypothetical protein DAI22_12g014800 [Oryza sativa Japonica Group]|nr:hypothetical protein DAI22_12g014800 [Oryza sativa Japonica Group]